MGQNPALEHIAMTEYKPPSWAALKAVHDHFMRVTFDICARGEEIAPQLFVVRANSQGRIVKMLVLPPDVIGRFMSSDRSKDVFSEFLADLLTPGTPLREEILERMGTEPNLLVQVNEAWVSTLNSEEAPQGTVRPSKDPNRKEAIVVTLHTPLMSIPVMHPIVDQPKRHATAGPFPAPEELQRTGGRFAMQEVLGARTATKH